MRPMRPRRRGTGSPGACRKLGPMRIFGRPFGAWSGLRSFNRLPRADRTIVFYAEGKADWPHLGPIIEELTESLGRTVCYVTSDETDPVFSGGNSRILPFFVGSGAVRTTFFRYVEAKVMVMTLPDLETFHLKRSVHPAHYVYVFHSIVSTHMTYRKGAFDAYDTVFCVGPHHVEEIRRTEEVYGLRRKQLVEHGYGRLDRILRTASERRASVPAADGRRKIVLAPSWGECSFIEAPYGAELIDLLLGGGHDVVLRLHPMTVRRLPGLGPGMEERFRGRAFRVETDMHAQESLHESEVMIGDWSGAALEYAFGLERPVLFIDTPKKINNPEYERIGRVPLEESVRHELGGVIHPGALGAALTRIDALSAARDSFRERLREARERWVYNVGRSAAVGATHVAELADRGGAAVTPAAAAGPGYTPSNSSAGQ